MKKIYPLEPMMHAGQAYIPGQTISVEEPEDVSAILASGRGTMDADIGKEAARTYEKQIKAAA